MSRSRSGSNDDQALGVLALLVIAGIHRIMTTTSPHALLILGVALASALILGLRLVLRSRARQRAERLLLADAAALSPDDFERRVQLLLQHLGWVDVRHEGGSGDGGVDLRGAWEGRRTIVQCKRYAGIVSPTHIRDLAGARAHEGADHALLVMTGRVSGRTRAWTADKPITIWDGAELAAQMRAAEVARRDPARQRSERQRGRWLLAGLVTANVLALVVGLAWLPAAPLVTATEAPTPKLRQTPTVAPGGMAIVAPLPTEPPTVTPAIPTATVANGGNVRQAPSLKGGVLDQVHARESVPLYEQSADGQWYRITTARAVTGWVHRSLLTVDPATAAQVPVEQP
ncbi:MAG: hypothetical protein RLZZ387_3300 [Chloroflexota bacterium]|jgi:restriction system protein